MTARPLVVVWRITTACDLACPFCGYSRDLRWPRQHISADDVLAFSAVLADLDREVHVSWLGGEPLLWPPLAEVSHALRSHGLRLGVTTNGTRLRAMMPLLAGCYERVTLSLDGLAAHHDALRGSAGLFDTLREGIAELKRRKAGDRGPTVCVNTVLMRSNLRRFDELLHMLARWGVDEATFNALGGFDRPGEFYDREKLLPEDIAWLCAELPHLRACVAPLRIRGSAQYLQRLEASARNHPLPVLDCAPGQDFLFVDERGLVSPCSFTAHEYGVHVSYLRTVDDLRQLAGHFTDRQRFHRATACDDCRSTQHFGKFVLETPT